MWSTVIFFVVVVVGVLSFVMYLLMISFYFGITFFFVQIMAAMTVVMMVVVQVFVVLFSKFFLSGVVVGLFSFHRARFILVGICLFVAAVEVFLCEFWFWVDWLVVVLVGISVLLVACCC